MGNKIQRIYVGSNLVRPTRIPQEETWNFRNMTLADLTSNGFTYGATNNGTPAMSSSKGFYSSTDGHVRLAKTGIDFSEATKFTLTADYYLYYASWVGDATFGFWLEDLSNVLIRGFFQMSTNSGYKEKRLQTQWATLQTTQTGIPTGEYAISLTLDFQTGAAKLVFPGQLTLSGTLTTAQIETIRNTKACVRATTCYNGGKQHELRSLYRKIE